jgi:hypothetical protein
VRLVTRSTKIVLAVVAGLVGLGMTCCLTTLLLSGAASSEAEAEAAAADVPAPEVTISGARQDWAGATFIIPEGMQLAQGPDGLQLTHPVGEAACTMVLLPRQPARGALEQQALEVVQATFAKDFAGVIDEFGGERVLDGRLFGTLGSVDYVELPKLLLRTRENREADVLVRALLFRVGDEVAPIVGFEVGRNRCLEGGAWLRLFHSLQFPGSPRDADDAMAQVLTGSWSMATSQAGLVEEFRADGSFIVGGATRSAHSVSETREQVTTTTWANGGRWAVHGAWLTSSAAGTPGKTSWFRVVRDARGQLELRRFGIGYDGALYEGRLRKDP